MKNKIKAERDKNHMKYKHIAILTVFMAILLICSLSTISAANNTINSTSTGGIAQGITDTGTGETLFLQPGTYNKTNQDTNITISKNITIQGNGSSDSVIIDAQGLSRIFTTGGNNLTITFINITFINGYGRALDGGAIYNNYAGTMMTFTNCTFANNTAENRGGTIRSNGVLNITNSKVINSTALLDGGAIHGINNISIVNSSFNGCSAPASGGVIYTTSSIANIIIINSSFTNNTANNGGVVRDNSGGNISIYSSNFTNNKATGEIGGGVIRYLTPGNLYISDSIFTDNSANSTAGLGGAIRFDGNNLTILNSKFIENSAGANGGAIIINGNATIANSTFIGNTANTGGAIFNYRNTTLTGSSFINNAADTYGGSIFNNGNMSVSSNTMSGNSAGLGQMIYNNGSMGVLNLTFIDNSTWVVKNGYTITLYATLTDDMGNTVTWQNISFYLDGVFFENVTSIEGKANITYTVPSSAGDIPISGEYAGIGTYNILVNNGLLKVRIPTKIIISVPKEVKVGDTVTLVSKLTDEDGNPLAGKTIDFYVDGVKVGSGVTDSNGIAKLNYTFTKAGKPKVESKFTGDNTYMASNATNQTTVSKIPTITTVETNKDTITAILTDENGNPLANKEVTITINGKTYTKTTNSQGQAIMKYKNAWDYKVTANFAGDEKYLGSNATAPKRTPTKITIKVKGDKVTATLTDENGTPLKGKKVVFRVKGIVIGVGTTDADGVATIFYKNAERYTITADFEGDDQYGPSSATHFPTTPTTNASGKVAMKETGLPIVAVLLALLSSIGLLGYRKRN